MFIAQFVIFFSFFLLLILAIVNCADYFDSTGSNDIENLKSAEFAFSDEEEDEEEDDKSNIVAFSKKSKKKTNSNIMKCNRKYFKDSRIAPLKMSSSVKNQVVVNDPQLFWKARTTKNNNGLILVDNSAYHNALKEGKAAGLVKLSDTNNHDATQLLMMMKKDSSFTAHQTMSFIPAPSKNVSKMVQSKKANLSKTTPSKSTSGGSVLKKIKMKTPSKIYQTLNANIMSQKKSLAKSATSKRKTKSDSKSLVTRRSK